MAYNWLTKLIYNKKAVFRDLEISRVKYNTITLAHLKGSIMRGAHICNPGIQETDPGGLRVQVTAEL